MTSNPDTMPGGSDFLRRTRCFSIQRLAPTSAWWADRRPVLCLPEPLRSPPGNQGIIEKMRDGGFQHQY